MHIRLWGIERFVLLQIGFFKSWSAYAKFKERTAGQEDFMEAFNDAFMAACDTKDVSKPLRVSWPIYVLLCKKRSHVDE